MNFPLPKHMLDALILSALEEDVGSGDVTTAAVLSGEENGYARVVAKSELVVAGIDIFRQVFFAVDDRIAIAVCQQDSQQARKGQVVAEITGSLAGILIAERVALNFFQRMCGIATADRKSVV